MLKLIYIVSFCYSFAPLVYLYNYTQSLELALNASNKIYSKTLKEHPENTSDLSRKKTLLDIRTDME